MESRTERLLNRLKQQQNEQEQQTDEENPQGAEILKMAADCDKESAMREFLRDFRRP